MFSIFAENSAFWEIFRYNCLNFRIFCTKIQGKAWIFAIPSETKYPKFAQRKWNSRQNLGKVLNFQKKYEFKGKIQPKRLNFWRIQRLFCGNFLQKQSYKFAQRGCPRKKLNPLSRIFSFGSKRFASFYTLFLRNFSLHAKNALRALNPLTFASAFASQPDGCGEGVGGGYQGVRLEVPQSKFQPLSFMKFKQKLNTRLNLLPKKLYPLFRLFEREVWLKFCKAFVKNGRYLEFNLREFAL